MSKSKISPSCFYTTVTSLGNYAGAIRAPKIEIIYEMSHSMTSINKFQTLLRQDTDGRWIHVMETVSYLTNLILVYDEIQSSPELFTAATDREKIYGI